MEDNELTEAEISQMETTSAAIEAETPEATRKFNESKKGDIWVRRTLWEDRERQLIDYAQMMKDYVKLATVESDTQMENRRLRETIQNQNARITQLESARTKTKDDVLRLHGFI